MYDAPPQPPGTTPPNRTDRHADPRGAAAPTVPITAVSVGPVLAGVVALVLWIAALASGAHLTMPRVVLVAPMIVYAVVVWITATGSYARTGEFAGSDGPAPWLAVAGFTAAPVLVLLLPPPLVVLVVTGFAVSVVALSPSLSERTSQAVATMVGGAEEVRGVEPFGGVDAELVSAHTAVAVCAPGGRIPPVWHPCLGRRAAANRIDPSDVSASLAAVSSTSEYAAHGSIRLHHGGSTVTGFGRRRNRAV